MRAGLGNRSQIGNIDGLRQGSLVWCVKKGIERDVLEDLVDSEFVRIEKHCMVCIFIIDCRVWYGRVCGNAQMDQNLKSE